MQNVTLSELAPTVQKFLAGDATMSGYEASTELPSREVLTAAATKLRLRNGAAAVTKLEWRVPVTIWEKCKMGEFDPETRTISIFLGGEHSIGHVALVFHELAHSLLHTANISVAAGMMMRMGFDGLYVRIEQQADMTAIFCLMLLGLPIWTDLYRFLKKDFGTVIEFYGDQCFAAASAIVRAVRAAEAC